MKNQSLIEKRFNADHNSRENSNTDTPVSINISVIKDNYINENVEIPSIKLESFESIVTRVNEIEPYLRLLAEKIDKIDAKVGN